MIIFFSLEIMVSRRESKQRLIRHRNAMTRYHKERQRNILAIPGPHEFVLVLDNLKAGFNAPKLFRSALAFGASAVHMINIEPFDPAPAKGAFRKVPAHFHQDFNSCYQQLIKEGYSLFRLETNADVQLVDCSLPVKSAFILGNEGLGHSFEQTEYPDVLSLGIPQFGQMESLNVSIAGSIVMYEYLRQHPLVTESSKQQKEA